MIPASGVAAWHAAAMAARTDPDRYYIRRPGAHAVMRCHPEGTPGVDTDSTVEINALGLRGRMPEDSDTPKILVIGGSTVEDALLDDSRTWCGQLEARIPGCWVGNAGRSGTNIRHHVIQIERIVPYLPKLDVIVVLCGLNDMLADLRCHNAEREPTIGQCFGYGPGIDAPENVAFDIGATFHAYKKRRAIVPSNAWRDHLPLNLAFMLDDYREMLERFIAVARAHAPVVVLVTQPSLWGPTMTDQQRAHCYAGGLGSPDEWFEDLYTPWFTANALATALAQYNDAMRMAGRGVCAPVIDVAEQLPRETENFYDDFHFSRGGAERMAEIVAREMRI